MNKILKNAWLKLASLAAAIMLSLIVNFFFSNNDSNTSVLQFIVPVEIKNMPEDLMIIWPPTRQVEVTLQGPTMFLSRISSPVFRVSLPPDAKNRFRANLKLEDLNLPPYVQALNINPSTIDFTLDRRISAKVPVVVPRIGSLPEELKVDQIKVEPSSVDVIGPENEIRGIGSVETTPLDLRDMKQGGQREMDLRVPGTFSEVKPKQALVTVELSLVLSEASFDGVPIEVRSQSTDSYRVNPPVVRVRVSGPNASIRQAKKNNIIPYVRILEPFEGSKKFPIMADLPEKLSVLSIEPPEADVDRVILQVSENKKSLGGESQKNATPKKQKK